MRTHNGLVVLSVVFCLAALVLLGRQILFGLDFSFVLPALTLWLSLLSLCLRRAYGGSWLLSRLAAALTLLCGLPLSLPAGWTLRWNDEYYWLVFFICCGLCRLYEGLAEAGEWQDTRFVRFFGWWPAIIAIAAFLAVFPLGGAVAASAFFVMSYAVLGLLLLQEGFASTKYSRLNAGFLLLLLPLLLFLQQNSYYLLTETAAIYFCAGLFAIINVSCYFMGRKRNKIKRNKVRRKKKQ